MQTHSYNVKEVTSVLERKAAYDLRLRVFVQEQGIPPELELDDLDQNALHAIVTTQGKVIGTGRLITVSPEIGSIGRMAVHSSFRRHGVGSLILNFLQQRACENGIQEIVLHAQEDVKDFYSTLGYLAEGDPFDEVGIPHLTMRKKLQDHRPNK